MRSARFSPLRNPLKSGQASASGGIESFTAVRPFEGFLIKSELHVNYLRRQLSRLSVGETNPYQLMKMRPLSLLLVLLALPVVTASAAMVSYTDGSQVNLLN